MSLFPHGKVVWFTVWNGRFSVKFKCFSCIGAHIGSASETIQIYFQQNYVEFHPWWFGPYCTHA